MICLNKHWNSIIVNFVAFRNISFRFVSFRCVSILFRSLVQPFFFLPVIYTTVYKINSNMTSFFRFENNRAIYRLGIISLANAPDHVTDFPVVNVHVDELSSARIWQHKLYATLSANVNINYRLPIKVFWLGIKY